MKNLLAVLFLCASAFAAPQYTTVTATLLDSSAQVWANASWTTEFSKPAGNNGPFNNNGVPITANQNGVANASGVFTVVLDNNLAVSPAGSGWKFTICPNATVALCNTIVLTIFGTSVDVSSQLNAVLTVPVVNTTQIIARAYNDTEVNASYGALYINSISNTLKQCIQINCNGSGWASFGVSSNNPTFTGTLTVPCVKFNFDLTNDSTLCSQPGTGHINLLLPSTGGTLALAGSSSPGAPTNSVQFNTGSGFGGDSNFTWDNTNKLLQVGGVSPTTSGFLTIIGTGAGSNANPIETHSSFANGLTMYTHSSTNFRAPSIIMARSRNTQGTPNATAAGDQLGYINFQGYDTSVYNTSSAIIAQTSDTFTTTTHGTVLEFQATLPGANAAIEVARFANTSSVNMFEINTGMSAGNVFGFGGAGNSALDTGISKLAAASFAFGNGTNGDTSAAIKAASATFTGLGTSTSPICPNGTGGALTTTGCVTGGSSGFPAQTAGGEHYISFNNSTTLSSSSGNNWPGGLFSFLGGAMTVQSNVAASSSPPSYKLITSGGTAGLSTSLSEDAVAKQMTFNIMSAYSCYCAISTGGQQEVTFGFSDTLYGALSVQNPNGNLIAFRYTGTTSTHWFAYVSTATATFTSTDTGVVADTNFHGFQFVHNAANGVDFYIDNVKVATIASGATGFPVNTLAMYMVQQAGLIGASIDLGMFIAYAKWWDKY